MASLGGCLIVGSAFAPSVFASDDFDATAFNSKVKPFLETYCINCHGPKKQKGDMRLDGVSFPIVHDDALTHFQNVLDMLELEDMPPEEKKQPSEAERKEIVGWLTQAVDQAFTSRTESKSETILRRLNHREYFNTIGDLFQMDMSMFNPTETFPADRTIERLDNIGEVLVTSGYLLDNYIEAADAIVEKALGVAEKPEPQQWVFNGDFKQQSELNSRHQKAHGMRYLNVYESPNSDLYFGSYAGLLAMKEGVPFGGIYEIKILAEAVNRRHDFDRSRVTTNPEEPMLMRVVPGHIRFGKLHLPQPYEPDLGTFELSDDGPEWHTVRTWLDEGFSPRFSYPNGSMNIRRAYSAVEKEIKKRLGDKISREDRRMDSKAFAIKYGVPHIRIHEVVIEGPYYDEWPTKAWKTVIGGKEFEEKNTQSILEQFANRAYRRPATKAEVDRLMAVVDARSEEGHSPFEALKGGLKAALCSPAFLYLEEPADTLEETRLSEYALASRLSYFLWGTMPDDELFGLAKIQKLSDAGVLNEQILRMLDDERSDNFVDGFSDSWLALRSLGDMPPDRSKFSFYYSANLEPAMREETIRFVRNALDENVEVSAFLNADYSFINEPLATLYGIEGVEGMEFRKVALTDKRRGGLLGQASILTVSANGVDTSPVYRGIWMLENIFGTPPPPPPDDVTALDTDTRGTTTIREQLKKHREVESCNECHRKIDPPGFALENFDAIGQWRTTYEEGGEIDASGVMFGGDAFNDVVGFKEAMMEREGVFKHAVAEKMLAYALGRRIQISDRPEIDDIIESLEERGNGFKDLVHLVALSDTFAKP